MKLENIGEIIAIRKLKFVIDGRQDLVEVAMGKPQQSVDGTDFYCPYHIKGGGKDKVMAIFGIDALQGMQLALKTIGVELATINRDSGGRLLLDGDETGQLDFSVPDWSD